MNRNSWMRRFLMSFTGLVVMMSACCGQNNKQETPMTKEDSIGAWNAVRKAHQMTDLPIYPVATLLAHKNKTYAAGIEEKGLIYSSTKEINTSVGQDVSFHTFMTALHNPRSLLYSERIDLPPYHGKNCRGYYGTVCSGLVTYALGFKITQRSADMPVADYMELVENQSAEGARLADVVWKKGHVQLVTGIERGKDGKVERIEISESGVVGCQRFYMDRDSFNRMLQNKKKIKRLYRYKYLSRNTSYTPLCEFVAVDGETKLPFVYNDDICTSKGDKACFIVGENIVLNVAKGYKAVEIFKDSILYKTVKIGNTLDIAFSNLPYGDYQARAVDGKKKSDFTYWKVIDVNVRIDREKNRIYFSSANATPVYYEFSSISGGRPTNRKRIYAAEFTEKQIRNGFVTVKKPVLPTKEKPGCPFVKVHFKCDYGMVINRPIDWFR